MEKGAEVALQNYMNIKLDIHYGLMCSRRECMADGLRVQDFGCFGESVKAGAIYNVMRRQVFCTEDASTTIHT